MPDERPPLPDESADLPRSALTRSARLMGLPLGYAGRAAVGIGRRLAGESADAVQSDLQRQAAEQMFRILGELKGGAMKFGQVLSLFEAMLPDEIAAPYRDHLRRLQDGAPPMPAARVDAVLASELGPSWRSLFREFGRRPAAAASIGQVHRAVWAATGEPVAVKIQYPGADQALRSDLAQISRLATVISPLTGGVDVRALAAETAERVAEEVDYLLEAENQRTAATAFAGSREFVVPEVLEATTRVLVTSWIDGRRMIEFAEEEAEVRNQVGLTYVRWLFAGPKYAGLLHADPHPGNYLVLPDGRLGVVDWGLAARLPDGLPPAMGRLIRAAIRGDAAGVNEGLRTEGFIAGEIDPDRLLDYLGPFVEPASVPEFHFTRAWLQEQFQRIASQTLTGDPVAWRLNVPPWYALIHRVWLGGIAVLSQLDVRAPFVDVVAEMLPGWDD